MARMTGVSMSRRTLRTLFAASLLVLSGVFCKMSEQPQNVSETPAPTPEATETAAPFEPATPTVGGAEGTGQDPKLARNFYVVFDGSGSMKERKCSGSFDRKIAAAQWAFHEFLAAVDPSVNLGLLVFDKRGMREQVPLGPGTRAAVEKAVDAVNAGEGTPLGPAIRQAVMALEEQREVQLGYGEYNIVVVTDGIADDVRAMRDAVKLANNEGFLLHTIAFCIPQASDLKTGAYSFRSADNPEELKAAVIGVLAESEDFQPMEFEKVQ
ncbi:MAG: vWA domain-containing protein [Acidobacteriota bacterium]